MLQPCDAGIIQYLNVYYQPYFNRLLWQQMIIKNEESQIRQFGYNNPMNIQNLLNFPDETVIKYLSDQDKIIQDHFPTEANTTTVDEDDSEALLLILAAEVQRMIQALETFWMQHTDTKDHFIRTLQQTRDKIRDTR